jgi:hypothetical protein
VTQEHGWPAAMRIWACNIIVGCCTHTVPATLAYNRGFCYVCNHQAPIQAVCVTRTHVEDDRNYPHMQLLSFVHCRSGMHMYTA